MLVEWQSRLDKILCHLSLLSNVLAVVLIPFWFKYSAWLVSETNCVTNVDWNNKIWRPCVLKLRLQERCVFIDHTLVHCDHWDHLGVTIHLINIPMQTEKIPSEETAETSEYTTIGLFIILLSNILFTFSSSLRKFTTICSSVLTLALIIALYAIREKLAEAVVDHRPTVYHGYGLIFYELSASLVFIGTGLMITRMLYVYHKNKSDKPYLFLPGKEPETVEMALQGAQNENSCCNRRENEDIEDTEMSIPEGNTV